MVQWVTKLLVGACWQNAGTVANMKPQIIFRTLVLIDFLFPAFDRVTHHLRQADWLAAER
jgi:hypothetical protein